MYPFIRLAWQFWKHRNDPSIQPTDLHVSRHICMPWDIDMWWELNNGRTLTLYDMSRLPLARKVGLIDIMKREKWGLTIAGVAVRYRKRIRMFQRFEIKSRALCWDERFMYLEQSIWMPSGECAGHALYRTALTDKNGIVTTDRLEKAFGQDVTSPPIPAWVQAWIDAEAQRPWPPMPDLAQ